MFFQWLKRYMPRSLYGRAALILILPVVLLQLVVSFGLITRHFEGVTEQMTRAVTREVLLVLEGLEHQDEVPDALPIVLDTLDMRVDFVEKLPSKDHHIDAVQSFYISEMFSHLSSTDKIVQALPLFYTTTLTRVLQFSFLLCSAEVGAAEVLYVSLGLRSPIHGSPATLICF